MAEPEIVEGDQQEVEKEAVKIDFDAVDAETGFKKVELALWTKLQDWKKTAEDAECGGQPGPDKAALNDPESSIDTKKAFLDNWVGEASNPDKPPESDPKAQKGYEHRAVYVSTLGIYAGERNQYEQRDGRGKAIYAGVGEEDDVYDGQFYDGKKNGQGMYISKSNGKSEIDKEIEKMVMEKPEDWRTAGQGWSGPGQGGHATIVPAKHEQFVAEVMAKYAVGKQVVETALEYGYYPCYHGEYQNGVRNGDGMMKNKDGSVYKGEWKNGKRHGQGIFYYKNGDVYSGHWNHGHKCGLGTYRFAHWEKDWALDKNGEHKHDKNGYLIPVYTLHYGGDYRGEWGEQEMKKPSDDGDEGGPTKEAVPGCFLEGEWRMPDGFHYEGTFRAVREPNEKFDVGRRNVPHTKKAPPPAEEVPPPTETTEGQEPAAPAPEPVVPKGRMHFRRWNLEQEGCMKFGHWKPDNALSTVAGTEDDGTY